MCYREQRLRYHDSLSSHVVVNSSDVSHRKMIEFASRYYYQKGRAEAGLSNDKFIDKAVESLLTQEKYNALLNPSAK